MTIMKFLNIVLLLLLFSACNKYLDKPGDPTQKVPQTLEDVEMMLDKPVFLGSVPLSSDEYIMTLGPNPAPAMKNYYLTWLPNDPLIPLADTYWSVPYSAVFNANLCLEILEKIGRTEANGMLFDRLKGSAHFTRAAAMTALVWQFAKAYNETTAKSDPGIVLDLNSDPLEKLQRSSNEDSYRQIIQDAEKALELLPLRAVHSSRPSKLAANGLLARIYLSMRKYDKVQDNCNAYLEQQTALIDFNDGAMIDLSVAYTMAPHQWGPEVIFFMSTLPGFPLTSYIVDTTLYAAYASNDIRKKAWFKPSQGYYAYLGSYLRVRPHSSICTPEMYIMRAECFARNNQIGKAMDDLNQLLKHRYETASFIPLTASGREEALELVLMERRKELLFYGLRWMDIKRLNEEGANISITRKLGDQTAVLPPRDPRFAMQLPSFLVETFGYIQNPAE